MSIGPNKSIEGTEYCQNGAANKPYEEFIYRIGRTRSDTADSGFDEETARSPLDGNERAFFIDKVINEHFWTSTPDDTKPDGTADTRKKPPGFTNLHVPEPNATDNPKTYNVS